MTIATLPDTAKELLAEIRGAADKHRIRAYSQQWWLEWMSCSWKNSEMQKLDRMMEKAGWGIIERSRSIRVWTDAPNLKVLAMLDGEFCYEIFHTRPHYDQAMRVFKDVGDVAGEMTDFMRTLVGRQHRRRINMETGLEE